MRKTIFFVSLIVCLASATALLIWTAKSNNPLHAQTTPSVSTKLTVLDFSNLPARVSTDVGVQTSMLKGQIAFTQTLNATGQTVRSLASFNAIGSSVRTRRGYTGTLGMKMSKSPVQPRTFDPSSGRIAFAFQQVFHYPLIDKRKGDRQIALDYSTSLVEGFQVDLSGQFSRSTSDLTTEMFTGQIRLELSQSVLGGVLGMELNVAPLPVRSIFGTGRCALGQRVIPIQPMIIRTSMDDPNPTGRSSVVFWRQASAIWAKLCVTFEILPTIYLEPGQFGLNFDKNIDSNQEWKDLLTAGDTVLNEVHNAVMVVFVESFDPGPRRDEGGAGTFYSGMEIAAIIVADNNHDLNPPSDNVLAHELGHAMGLCHPFCCDRCDECRVTDIRGQELNVLARGSQGTVMNNTGSAADNPAEQSLDNWRNISSPHLKFTLNPCCLRNDCISGCGDCSRFPFRCEDVVEPECPPER